MSLKSVSFGLSELVIVVCQPLQNKYKVIQLSNI